MGWVLFVTALASFTVWVVLAYGPKDQRTGRSLLLPAPQETCKPLAGRQAIAVKPPHPDSGYRLTPGERVAYRRILAGLIEQDNREAL